MGGGYKPMSESIFSRELETSYKKVKRKDANYFEGIAQKPFPLMQLVEGSGR